MAFAIPSFLWEKQDEGSENVYSGQASLKSKPTERSEELRMKIIKPIPDFLDVVKSSKMVKTIGWFAAYELHSYSAAAADRSVWGSKEFVRLMTRRTSRGLSTIDDNS
jgi:hypothetical protein